MKKKASNESKSLQTTSVASIRPDQFRNEIFTAGAASAAAAMGKLGYEIYKDYRDAQGPFFVSVVNSFLSNKYHIVWFELKNNTPHALYIEKVSVALPESRTTAMTGVRFDHRFTEESRLICPQLLGHHASSLTPIS